MPNLKFPPIFEDKLTGIPESDRDMVGRQFSDIRAKELELNPIKGDFDIKHLAKIHEYLFQDSSTHAGVVRGYGMNKGGTPFADSQQMDYLFDRELPFRIETLGFSVNDVNKYIDAMTDLHSTLDLAHPFREGNGRSTRAFMSQLAKEHGYDLDFSKINQKEWIKSCIHSINKAEETLKRPIFEKIVSPSSGRLIELAFKNVLSKDKNLSLSKNDITGLIKSAAESITSLKNNDIKPTVKMIEAIVKKDMKQFKEISRDNDLER